MKKCFTGFAALVLAGLFCNVAMARKVTEGVTPSGVIYVLVDRNITPDMELDAVKARNALADWWEVDLVNVLAKRGGYDAKLIQTRGDFVSGPDTYLLTAKILKYNPGSKAARILVGFGAGSCSMDIHIEFFSAGNKQIFSKDDGVGSGRDWRNVARKLNENILKTVTEALKKSGE